MLAAFHPQFDGPVFTLQRRRSSRRLVRHGPGLLAVNPHRHLKVVRRTRSIPLRVDPENILPGGREAVHRMQGAGQSQPRHVIVRDGKRQSF